jgi:hypothetical protein
MIGVIGEFNVMVDDVLVNVLKGAKRAFVKSNELLFVLEPEMGCSEVDVFR